MSGHMANLNMWDFTLTDDEIAALSLTFPSGNVINDYLWKAAGGIHSIVMSIWRATLPSMYNRLIPWF